ncbi:hypothetical protein AU14_13345 [Marinobacter similis]|uniref:VWFA domain-containing protein n=1 Tax=Marinobacter similis TaxID=1420916 RepID=W5YUI4_9GAMM|nr:hypothetical protein AU14_13345 [Marinobacter similis]
MRESGLGMAGRATAIGDAVGLSIKRLRERPQDQRVVILLTDGANTAGEITPDKATEIAKPPVSASTPSVSAPNPWFSAAFWARGG